MNNWSLNPEQFNDLATSLNSFFAQTGLIINNGGVTQSGLAGAQAPFTMSQSSTSSAGTGKGQTTSGVTLFDVDDSYMHTKTGFPEIWDQRGQFSYLF